MHGPVEHQSVDATKASIRKSAELFVTLTVYRVEVFWRDHVRFPLKTSDTLPGLTLNTLATSFWDAFGFALA